MRQSRRLSNTTHLPLDESDKLFDTEQWVASTLTTQFKQSPAVESNTLDKPKKGKGQRKKSGAFSSMYVIPDPAEINKTTATIPAPSNSLKLPAISYAKTSLNLLDPEGSRSAKASLVTSIGNEDDNIHSDNYHSDANNRNDDNRYNDEDDNTAPISNDVFNHSTDINVNDTGQSTDAQTTEQPATEQHIKQQKTSTSTAPHTIPEIRTTSEKVALDRPAMPNLAGAHNQNVTANGECNNKTKRRKRNKLTREDAKDLSDENVHQITQSPVNDEEVFKCPSAASKRRIAARVDHRHPTVKFYNKVCKKLGVLPLRKVTCQFGRTHLSFRNLTLTTKDMKGVCLALQKEQFACSLDFTGNFMGVKELDYLITVLNHLRTVFQVSLCNNCLSGQAIKDLSQFLLANDFLARLDLSGNKLNDCDAPAVTDILKKNVTMKTLVLNHNEFREEGGRLIGQALGDNTTLEDIDLSWNHLRRCGAVGIAKGLQANTALRTVNLAWNGFGFEGCVAIGDMLTTNYTITELDLAYNRINPPALLELLRGVAANKTLRILKIGYNPITAAFSSLILAVVKKHRETALENIDLAGVVVDKEFVALLEEIQRDRFFIVNYEVSLPVKKISREEMREKIGLPSAYNVDPLRMLYLLKEKMRASDFFYKINKDHDDGLQRGELYTLFDEAGIPVTGSVIDKIMEFMDTNGDGTIDLSEFLQGDKRIKNISRKQIRDEQDRRHKDASYTKYSRTFQKAHIDPITNALKVDASPTPMRQSRRPSVAKTITDSETDDNNHLRLP